MVSSYDVRVCAGLNHILWLKSHIARRAGKVVLTTQNLSPRHFTSPASSLLNHLPLPSWLWYWYHHITIKNYPCSCCSPLCSSYIGHVAMYSSMVACRHLTYSCMEHSTDIYRASPAGATLNPPPKLTLPFYLQSSEQCSNEYPPASTYIVTVMTHIYLPYIIVTMCTLSSVTSLKRLCLIWHKMLR